MTISDCAYEWTGVFHVIYAPDSIIKVLKETQNTGLILFFLLPHLSGIDTFMPATPCF